MKKYLLLLLSLVLMVVFPVMGQYSTTNKKAIKCYEEADLMLKSRQSGAKVDYDKVTKLLEDAIEKDPAFVEAHLKIASVYKLFGKNDKARVYFEKAAELKPNSKDLVMVYYTLGEYSFNDGDYEKAKKQFDKVIKVNPTEKKVLENTNKYIEKINFGIEAKKNPISFNPVMMSPTVNKYFIHAYPVLTADQETLIYMKRVGGGINDDEDIVISKKVNGQWTQPESISDKINSAYNEGACTISADGTVLVFASANRKDGLGAADLYITYKEGDDWKEPVNLGANVNSNVWDSEPALSADGRTIYFASERKGGFGEEDIWMTQLDENGQWKPAVNLGKDINTKGREVSPFIHANGNTLYFSSNFLPGMGAFDIFYSKFDGLSWTKPKNLGYPLNTHLDDVTVFITPDNKKGLYSKYHKKDMRLSDSYLYEFDVPKEIVDEIKSTYSKGTVYDSETKQKIGAKIELIDLKANKVVQSTSADAKKGTYLIVLTEGKEYALYVQKEGYLFKSTFFDYKNPKSFDPLTLDVYLDPIKAGKSVVLNNIFFPSNSYALEDKSLTELDKIIFFLQKNPKLSIEFGGHTDDVGSDKDNLQLSLKRAQSVYEYIVKKGIPASRLKYNGYGESKPIVPNTSEENRLMNRRIEFKVL